MSKNGWAQRPLSDKTIPFKGKVILSSGLILVLFLSNVLIRIHLPGISNVDIRPQIVLIALAGYLLGPVYGFIVGFGSNLVSDLLLGYGLHYLLSWTIGNGLIGLLMGCCRLRRKIYLDKIKQLMSLTIALIIINIVSFAYATSIEIIRDTDLSTAINFRYFFLPAVLSNIIGMLVLFPALLLAFRRIKLNFPVKISLINYYLTIFIVFLSWAIFAFNLTDITDSFGVVSVETGNAFVRSFNHWTLLLSMTLVLSFLISGWISRLLVLPLTNLEKSVFEILKGNPDAVADLVNYSHRQDEIGVLSKTVTLLSEKLMKTQKLFRDEMNKKMKFIHQEDSGTDVLIVGIISMFGKEAFESIENEHVMWKNRAVKNIEAVDILISAAGLRELSSTYSENKIKKSLENLVPGLDEIIRNIEEKQALALAIDLNLIFKGRLMILDLSAPLEQDFAYHLLENLQALKQSEKRYIGYLTQPDLIGKIQEKWSDSGNISDNRMQGIMDEAIANGIISGYQIKCIKELANFDEELKLTYSHSNFKHVKQLIGLLIGEGVQAKVQLEQKTSSFIYLNEWERLSDLHLKVCAQGFSIAHKKEFDIVFEFSTQPQRDLFHSLITNYAKMENDRDKKLLYESWYQPLFCSTVSIADYQRIANLNFSDGEYLVCTYCKESDKDKLMNYFRERAVDFNVTPLWVNDAFYRYLDGDFE